MNRLAPILGGSDARIDAVSTSALGDLLRPGPRLSVIVVGGMLAVPATSSAEPNAAWGARYEHASTPTTSSGSFDASPGFDSDQGQITRRAVGELRRISGLTWDQLGQLFEVSRRSVHFWASGKAMSAGNLARLMRLLDVVRVCDRGDARSNRAALFQRTAGKSPFDLLVAQRFDEAQALLGSGRGRPKVASVPLDAESRRARTPPPPADLVDARHDRVHRDIGRGRAANTVRNKRRGPSR